MFYEMKAPKTQLIWDTQDTMGNSDVALMFLTFFFSVYDIDSIDWDKISQADLKSVMWCALKAIQNGYVEFCTLFSDVNG